MEDVRGVFHVAETAEGGMAAGASMRRDAVIAKTELVAFLRHVDRQVSPAAVAGFQYENMRLAGGGTLRYFDINVGLDVAGKKDPLWSELIHVWQKLLAGIVDMLMPDNPASRVVEGNLCPRCCG